MLFNCRLLILVLSTLLVATQSLPTGNVDETKKTEQTTRPKVVKRSQELLMFGNQQNHHAMENKDSHNHAPSVEKRTLSNSGLEDVSAALSEPESDNRPKALPSSYIMDQPALPQHEKNYEYGRILVNELDDVLPRGPWDMGPGPSLYGRYYGGLNAEDRRKRSEDSNSPTTATAPAANTPSTNSNSGSSKPVSSSSSTSTPAVGPASSSASQFSLISQPKRSVASYYQEPRYKRESDVDPDKLYALLSLYDNERRNRGNWRNYGNDEYDAVDDDSNMIGLDDEDPNGAWLDNSLVGYPQQQHHYLASDPILNSELAALGHASRPYGYYDQYIGQQYAGAAGNGQQYDTGVQYGTPQYAVPYALHGSYYPPEKRFMVSRKRSQNFDSYGTRNFLLNNKAYPNYQRRLFY